MSRWPRHPAHNFCPRRQSCVVSTLSFIVRPPLPPTFWCSCLHPLTLPPPCSKQCENPQDWTRMARRSVLKSEPARQSQRVKWKARLLIDILLKRPGGNPSSGIFISISEAQVQAGRASSDASLQGAIRREEGLLFNVLSVSTTRLLSEILLLRCWSWIIK